MRRRGRGRGSVSSLFLKTVLFVDVAFAAFYQRHFEAKNHLKEEVQNVVFLLWNVSFFTTHFRHPRFQGHASLSRSFEDSSKIGIIF